MTNIGTTIRTLRKQHSMTQDELAELLHVTRQTVSNYENGKSEPDLETLLRIAEILETDVSTLLEQNSAPSATDNTVRLRKHILSPMLVLVLLWLSRIASEYVLYSIVNIHRYSGFQTWHVLFVFTEPLLYVLLGYVLAVLLSLIAPKPFGDLEQKWIHRVLTAVLLFYLLLLLHQVICSIHTDILYFKFQQQPLPRSFVSPEPLLPIFSRLLIRFWLYSEAHQIIFVPLFILFGMALAFTKTRKTEVM